MPDPLEDRIVEAMARAMCAAEGTDPDSDELDGIKAWEIYEGPARRQYHAHAAMRAILDPPPEAGKWERHTDSDGDAKFIYVPTVDGAT